MRCLSLAFLTACALYLTAMAAEESAPPTTGSALPELKSFDDVVVQFMSKHKIPGGALAVFEDGRLLYARGYGYADREKKTPVQPTSLFRLASVSKPITAVAVMRLIQDGKLSLESKVVPLLGVEPFVNGERKVDPRIRDITVQHLLNHSGGWDRAVSGDIMFKHFLIADEMKISSPPDHASLLRWGFGQTLDFDPGTKYAYSNFGYCVLGRVIEKISGQSYETFVKERVLAPAGITDMRIGEGRQRERCENEVCYYDANNRLARNVFSADGTDQVSRAYAFESPRTMDAHGGWIASAVDLAKFACALDKPPDPPLLQPAFQAALFRRPSAPLGQKPNGTPADIFYASGWQVRPQGSPEKFNSWHSGSMPGTATLLVRLANKRGWVVLFNQDVASQEIDGMLHAAAAKVKAWPKHDLFKNKNLEATESK